MREGPSPHFLVCNHPICALYPIQRFVPSVLYCTVAVDVRQLFTAVKFPFVTDSGSRACSSSVDLFVRRVGKIGRGFEQSVLIVVEQCGENISSSYYNVFTKPTSGRQTILIASVSMMEVSVCNPVLFVSPSKSNVT